MTQTAQDSTANTPTELAAAAYDLWQQQWELLRSDPTVVKDLQILLEHFGRSMSAVLMQTNPMPAQGGLHAAAPSDRPAPFAAAFGAGQPNLAELAAAVAELATRVNKLEVSMAPQPAAKSRQSSGRKRKNTA